MAWLRSVDEFTGSLNNIEGFTQGTGEKSPPLTALQWGELFDEVGEAQ